jgi:predicted amidophosphoribosyltransferase
MKRTFQPMCCARCRATFTPLSGHTKVCPACRPEMNRERVGAWRMANRERDRENRRKLREKNKEAAKCPSMIA